MSNPLTHIGPDGRVNMVDVGNKDITDRSATASGFVRLSPTALAQVETGANRKGDVMTVAEIAGIMGAKKTSDLIPLCHPLPITSSKVTIEIAENGLSVSATIKTRGQTGVEMEALSAVSLACLTIYDMLKAIDKSMVIGPIELIEKTGGKSGSYRKS